MRIRSLVQSLASLMAALAIGYAAYWFHVAGELRKGVEDFLDQRRAEGWVVELETMEGRGFPLRVTLELTGLRLGHPSGSSWRADRLAILLNPLDPLGMTLDLAGHHAVTLPLPGGEAWRAILSAAPATLSARLRPDGGVDSLSAAATALALEQAGEDPVTAEGLTLHFDRLRPTGPGHDQASAGFTLALAGVTVPEVPGGVLDRRIATLQLEGQVMGTPPAGPPGPAMAAWSAEGGVVELNRVALDWAPLSLDGDATLAFDAAMQPLLASSAHIRGWAEMVVRLVRAGLLEPGMASVTQTLLAILARPDDQGRSTLNLPVTLQDGILTAGQVRLGRLPPFPVLPREAAPAL